MISLFPTIISKLKPWSVYSNNYFKNWSHNQFISNNHFRVEAMISLFPVTFDWSHDQFIFNSQLIWDKSPSSSPCPSSEDHQLNTFYKCEKFGFKTFFFPSNLAEFSVLRNQTSNLTSTKESNSIVVNVDITCIDHSHIMHNKIHT